MTGKSKEAEVNPIKGVSITPTITALLKPTVDYLGIEIRDYFKANVEEWKAKRRERNLNAHLEAVRNKLTKEPASNNQSSPSIRQLVIFDEWIEKAQDIDPEDSELSDIWQNLLAKAARGERVPTEVLAALKSLSPKEAQFLVGMVQRTQLFPFLTRGVNAENRYLAKSLEAKGIIEADYTFLIIFLLLLSVCGVIAYNFGAKIGTAYESGIPMSSLIGVALVAGFVGIGFSMWSVLVHWRGSWLGRTLLEYATSRTSRHPDHDAQPDSQAGLRE